MLFLESKTLNHPLNTDSRLALLQDLQERSLIPVIRSQRLRSFEDVLLGAEHIGEMEKALAASTESTTGDPYVRGDLFSFSDSNTAQHMALAEAETTTKPAEPKAAAKPRAQSRGMPKSPMKFAMLARNVADLGPLPEQGWVRAGATKVAPWTDDYSDIIGAILRKKMQR